MLSSGRLFRGAQVISRAFLDSILPVDMNLGKTGLFPFPVPYPQLNAAGIAFRPGSVHVASLTWLRFQARTLFMLPVGVHALIYIDQPWGRLRPTGQQYK